MSSAPIPGASTRPTGPLLRFLLTAATTVLVTGPVLAHDATPTPAQPLGWRYPFSCCADYDCRTASEGEVLERPGGYVIAGTGEVVPMTDGRIKDSPDGQYHWCAHRTGLDAGRTICLFVPPHSF
ncbi:MAG TPA: hypothetical protein PKD01_14175 [Mesorhizobium sp.]|nr:hypothetical protein [Mesorhizobium sp.]